MNQLIQNGHHRQEESIVQALERLLNDARKGKLKGAVFCAKYSVWHHGVWVVGDYVSNMDDALDATGKMLETMMESKGRKSPEASDLPHVRGVGMLYRMILLPDGSSKMPFCTEAIRRIFRLAPEQVAENAHLISKALHPEDVVRITQQVTKAAMTGGFTQLEYRTLFPDGAGAHIISKAEVTLLPDGSSQWDGVIVEHDP